MQFTKMCASNNDFILVDHRQPFIAEPARLASDVCRHRYSIGADGLILLENSSKADFRMRFFNPDGGEVEMCGNGSRAISIFAQRLGIIQKRGIFETPAGLIETEIINERQVKVKLTEPHSLKMKIRLNLGGTEQEVHFINTGVPHVVVPLKDVAEAPVNEWGRNIRYAPQFAPAGTNANFIQLVEKNYVKIRTYERGVEAETLACGTGSVAGAIIAYLVYGVKPPLVMLTEGGDSLLVHFEVAGESVKNVYLEGPVVVVYQGEYLGEIA